MGPRAARQDFWKKIMSRRRKSREYALQLLFRLDLNREEVDWGVLREFWNDKTESEEVRAFAEELVTGVTRNLGAVDARVTEVAANWSLRRMAAVDRGLLRLGAYEILFRDDIPHSVTINEILEISKKYSTLESAAFINGILDKVAMKETGG